MEIKQNQEIIQQPHHPVDYDPNLNGIGGWLILIMIGKIANILFGVVNVIELIKYMEYGYSQLLYIILGYSVVVEILLSGLCLYYIFTYNIAFRTIFVIQTAIVLVFMLICIGSLEYFDSSALGRTIIGAAISIPYLYKSKRVKNTYIYKY